MLVINRHWAQHWDDEILVREVHRIWNEYVEGKRR